MEKEITTSLARMEEEGAKLKQENEELINNLKTSQVTMVAMLGHADNDTSR